MTLSPILADDLSDEGVDHAFFTREGGVSGGIYAGLNTGIGSDDDREDVLENRARAAGYLGGALRALATPHQTHSRDVATVTEVWEQGRGPKADAVVTDRPGVIVGVGTADCGPILLSDPQARVVAAAHSGWKGAIGGVIEGVLKAMEALGARRERIVAVLGPTIAQSSYEVGNDFRVRFETENPDNAIFFKDGRKNHAQFDLPGFIVSQLRAAGVARARALGCDTYADESRFYSYRRATHRGETDYGRLLSAISLRS